MKSLVAHAHAPAAWGFRRRPGTRLDVFRAKRVFRLSFEPEQGPEQVLGDWVSPHTVWRSLDPLSYVVSHDRCLPLGIWGDYG